MTDISGTETINVNDIGQKGYDDGYDDGQADCYDDAYDDGYDDGKRIAQYEIDALEARIAELEDELASK